MATSGTATVVTGLLGERKVEKVFYVDLNSSGVTAADFVITLDQTFRNTPKMLAVPPQGADQTFALTYTPGTPSLDLAVSGGTITTFDSQTVPVIVIAYDQP